MPKKKFPIAVIIFISCILLFAGVIGGVYRWWTMSLMPVNPADEETVQVVIPKGSGVIAIAGILKDKNLIHSPLAFRLQVMRSDMESKLQAGSYHLSPSQSLREIITSLSEGREDFWVTIPEGKRREEIAGIIAQAFTAEGLPFSESEFLDISEDLEGYLFPDTYLVPRTMDATGVVELLRSTFDSKITDEEKVKASDLKLSFQDVLILASLVEREAKFEADRPKVARVLLNRMEIGMPLQVDATVQYAVGSAQCLGKPECKWWPVISDTKFRSPYNTYENPGLPPGPICSPGMASIEAVLEAEDHDYLYYLSEPSGKTHYAKTLAEHEENIGKYLR